MPLDVEPTAALAIMPATNIQPAEPPKSKFPPQLKMGFSIEPAFEANKMQIWSGPYMEPIIERVLDKPYSLCMLYGKGVARFHEDAKTSSRFYQGGASEEAYQAALKRVAAKEKYTDIRGKIADRVDTGNSYIVVVLQDGAACLCLFEALKTQHAYWHKATVGGAWNRKQISDITQTDHKANLKQSKTGGWYHNPSAFNKGWSSRDMTKTEGEMILEVYKPYEEFIKEWLAK